MFYKIQPLTQKSNIDNHFYRNLGLLFYAIAAADNTVEEQEIKKLNNLVKTEWKSITDFNSDGEGIIIKTFMRLDSSDTNNAEGCYNSFISYMKSHTALFTPDINALITRTATKITTSFSGQNKSELIMLAKLDLELKKLDL